MTSNSNTTKRDIIDRVVRRLRHRFGLGEKSIFPALSLQMVNPANCPDTYIVVAPMQGQFIPGHEQFANHIGERFNIGVTCANRLRTIDESGRAHQLLVTSDKSLLQMEQDVLIALAGWDYVNAEDEDSPIAVERSLCLESCTAPALLDHRDGSSVCVLSIVFSCQFYWDLGIAFDKDLRFPGEEPWEWPDVSEPQ